MCWVMPPASLSTTAVSRMASSSVVLPWSTWPMIVTTGGRRLERVRLVLERDLLGLLVGGVLDLDLALELGADQLDGLVGQRLRDRAPSRRRHQSVMILAGETPSFSARSLTVIPDGTLTGPAGTSGSRRCSCARSAALAPLTGACGRPGRRSRRGGGLAATPRAAGGRGGRAGPVQTAARRPSRRRRAVPLRRRRRRARPDRRRSAASAASTGSAAGSAVASAAGLGFSCSAVFFATTSVLPCGLPAAPCAPAPPGRRAA